MALRSLVTIHSSCLLYEALSVSLDACAAGTRSGVGIPSITLPSFQFPGLLCFGGGFLNLITPFFESFFVLVLMSSATGVGHESVQMRLHLHLDSRMPTFRISHRDGCVLTGRARHSTDRLRIVKKRKIVLAMARGCCRWSWWSCYAGSPDAMRP